MLSGGSGCVRASGAAVESLAAFQAVPGLHAEHCLKNSCATCQCCLQQMNAHSAQAMQFNHHFKATTDGGHALNEGCAIASLAAGGSVLDVARKLRWISSQRLSDAHYLHLLKHM